MTSKRLPREETSMDPESLPQRQVESLQAIEERLEYLADVLVWIGEIYADRSGHRAVSAGTPKQPPQPDWRSGPDE